MYKFLVNLERYFSYNGISEKNKYLFMKGFFQDYDLVWLNNIGSSAVSDNIKHHEQTVIE